MTHMLYDIIYISHIIVWPLGRNLNEIQIFERMTAVVNKIMTFLSCPSFSSLLQVTFYIGLLSETLCTVVRHWEVALKFKNSTTPAWFSHNLLKIESCYLQIWFIITVVILKFIYEFSVGQQSVTWPISYYKAMPMP